MSSYLQVPLEPQAEQVCRDSARPPLIFQRPPEKGRRILEQAQDSPVYKYPATVCSFLADTGKWGKIRVHAVIPQGLECTPNVIFYIHGAGWVFGSLHTHDKLVREIAARTSSVVIFPEYSRSPEARYPTAIEQCYSVLAALPSFRGCLEVPVSLKSLTVAGDSVGGNMATVMTILAKERGGPYIHKQLMYYPVTNAAFNTGSYGQFARGYYLYRAGMEWFWDQYTRSPGDRNQITASPLRASLEDLRNLPPALIINGEADVLRDEGEAYARRLRRAGVEVTQARFQGIIHDFVMLNSLDQTNATRGAMDLSTAWINQKNQ